MYKFVTSDQVRFMLEQIEKYVCLAIWGMLVWGVNLCAGLQYHFLKHMPFIFLSSFILLLEIPD